MPDKIGYRGAIEANGTPIPELFRDTGTGGGFASGPTNMGGYSDEIVPTVTVSTSPAYSVGDCVGGKLTLSSIVRSGSKGLLVSVLVSDTSNQKAGLELLIFNADPSGSTLTDNTAAVIAAADVSKVIRRISIAASDYVTIDSKAFADIVVSGRELKPASGTDLYAALVTTGTPTYAATTALGLRLGVLQD